MIVLLLWLLSASVYTVLGLDGGSYSGCYSVDDGLGSELQNKSFIVKDSGACALKCQDEGFQFFGTWAQEVISCRCFNGTEDLQPLQNEDCCLLSCLSESCLPLDNSSAACWRVSLSDGPYLTDLDVQCDGTWVVKDAPVFFEVIAMVTTGFLHDSESEERFQGQVTVQWRFGGSGGTLRETLQLDEQGQLYHRVQHRFRSTGPHVVEVRVSNEVSEVKGEVTVEVVFPEPQHLQFSIHDDDDLDAPSCIPEGVDIGDRKGPLVAVFVNTTQQFEASVSMGTNLTFTFWFEDSNKTVAIQPCRQYGGHDLDPDLDSGRLGVQCLEVAQNHTFRDVGVFTVVGSVANKYGSLVETITVVVMEEALSDVVFTVHEDSDNIVTFGDTVTFLVSMVTTYRSNTFLSVDYGDGSSRDVVSIRDTNTSAMILEGEGQAMDIAASYGDGCRLSVTFKHGYQSEGWFQPVATVFRNRTYLQWNMSGLAASELEDGVLVLRELIGLRLEADRIAACSQTMDFAVHFASRVNLTVTWTIFKVEESEDVEIVENLTTSSLRFSHRFDFAGAYVVLAQCSNAVSRASVRANVMVQCPIHNLQAYCMAGFVRTNDMFQCSARVESGTAVIFQWFIEGPISARYNYNENNTSLLRHRFSVPGLYDITVQAVNNISSSYFEIQQQVLVQEAIQRPHVEFYHQSRTLLGEVTMFGAAYSPPSRNIRFDFDIGDGRQNMSEVVCNHEKNTCFITGKYIFKTPGIYEVQLHAYNHVSELVETLEVWVIRGLENITVEVMGVPVVEIPSIFVLKEHAPNIPVCTQVVCFKVQSVVMETDNIYFQWRSEDGHVTCTNAPLFEMAFPSTGNHTVTLLVTNPVTTRTIEIIVDVKERSEPNVLLKHDLVVAPATMVDFHLQVKLEGPLMGWSRLLVSYSDGEGDMFEGVKFHWLHQFNEPDVYQINITLMGSDGAQTEVMTSTMTSYLMVEEPITGVDLRGPTAVAYEERFLTDPSTHTWYTTMMSGTHVVYRWSVGGEPITNTLPEFKTSVRTPGQYNLSVEVFNDLTPPITSELSFAVEYPITDIGIDIRGNLVGKETGIQVAVQTFSSEFYYNVDFGDGSSGVASYFDAEEMSSYVVNVYHTYTEPGEYHITANVSNGVSYVNRTVTFTPIADIVLTTKSPSMVRTQENVVVSAVVDSDQNLDFTWDFSDNFDETHSTRYPNQTSVATHAFGLAGEYVVKFNVTGHHYPPPGISVRLPVNFTAIDPIEVLRLEDPPKFAALVGGTTRAVVFKAVSSGSHVNFKFDFGDGNSTEVPGTNLPYFSLQVEMTMTAEAEHVYTQVGEYQVEVTAFNPLGNMTFTMSRSFCVEEPPSGLLVYLEGPLFNRRTHAFATKFGDIITFNAMVEGGTNVVFNWKFGDQTDLVKAGPVVTHQYRTAGKKTVYLTAENCVHQVSRNVTVFIDHEIQGVEVVPSSDSVVVMGQSRMYRAVMRPTLLSISGWYKWTIRTVYSRPRERWTKLPVISHRFRFSGVYSITVSAGNAISRVTSPSLAVHVHAEIENLGINVVGHLVARQPVKLAPFYHTGSSLTFTWELGDGSEAFTKTVTHVYTRPDEYVVRLTASNVVSSQTVTRKLFILDRPYCRPPGLSILLQQHSQVYHSRQLTVEAHITLDCNISSAVDFHWTLVSTAGEEVVRVKERVMVLSPGTLPYGKYTVQLKVAMRHTNVYAVDEMDITVVPSPLVSSILGGNFRRLSPGKEIVLDGSRSLDPDTEDTRHLHYQWRCRFTSEDGSTAETCFKPTENVTVAMDTAVLALPTESLVEASNFTFELLVYSDGRVNDTSFQVIEIVKEQQNILDVKIMCPQCATGPVNPNRKLSLYVQCENCPLDGSTVYAWRLFHVAGSNPYNPVRAHDNYECVEPNGNSYIPYKLPDEADTREVTAAVFEQEEREEAEEDMATQKGLEIEALDWGKDVMLPLPSSTQKPVIPLPPWDVLPQENAEQGEDFVPKEPPPRSRWDKGRNQIPYDGILENIDPFSSNRRQGYDNLPEQDADNTLRIEEGSPGESGSSGGRAYLPPRRPVDNDVDTGMDTDVSSGGILDGLDKLTSQTGGQRQPMTVLDQVLHKTRLQEEDTRTGVSSPSLVVKPGVLRQGLTYIALVQISSDGGRSTGEARATFTVNESPIYGDCTIKPDSGVELRTEFSILCKNWQDPHGPLMYEVSYSFTDTGRKNLIYRGLDRQLTFKLPCGRPANDFKVLAHIDILDSLLAKTSVCFIAIQVLPHTQEISSAVNDRNETLWPSDVQLIHEEVTGETGTLARSLDVGDNALSRVYIGYLASWLNRVNRTKVTPGDHTFHVETRTQLLQTLASLPVRNEAEILQTAQALSPAVAQSEELNQASIDLAIGVLEAILAGVEVVYNGSLAPVEDLVPLTVEATSSVFEATSNMPEHSDPVYEKLQKQMVAETVDIVQSLVLTGLKHQVLSEKPIEASTGFLSVLASRHTLHTETTVQIEDTKFHLPTNLNTLLKTGQSPHGQLTGGIAPANENCFQSHMTTFKRNPFSFGRTDEKVQSSVSSLSLFSCDGQPITVKNLTSGQQILVELPNQQSEVQTVSEHVLKKWVMNIHQFSASQENRQHALHLVVELEAVRQGRLFPISVLISYQTTPTPTSHLYKQDFPVDVNTLDVFLPAGSLNTSGVYYIGIVDSTYNAGRLREGEVTLRRYKLKLWWGECLYWDVAREAWLPDGCQISQSSSFKVTRCSCSHLTAFGGRFDLIPNKLSLVDVESFFSPSKNSVALILIGVIVFLYIGLLIICRHADLHDAKKGGIVYLLDNNPIDQQKYEVVVETGFRKGAGTSAKVSIILHGEEGMSETRELISEDQRPLFERNSRDKFILTLPDSIGKIWKVQLWHNNFGHYPSWYLSRVSVRDLNSGSAFFFMCERWLAVEEDDGKVEREFTALEGPLGFSKVFVSKGVEYMADFHTWTSLITRPSYSGFMRTERLTCCLTTLMMYMCLNAVWYKTTETEYRGEFGLLDLSWRNVAVGGICCAVVIPVSLLLELLFRRSKPEHVSNCQSRDEAEDPDQVYPSGKPNQQESEDSEEHVPPIMTYSLLDQSILNWPTIQHWAQRQWLKRQQSVRSSSDSNSGNSAGSQHSASIKPLPCPAREVLISTETDQASSGFEDSSSLIRPQASADSTHTTAAPSVAESMRTHKPQSLGDSLRALKPPSVCDNVKTSKAPSISSSCSQKSSALTDRRENQSVHMYLPFWCRYLAWSLCCLVCITCATVTAMYGFRFGIAKSTMWLQSLYFSFMICVFISNPIMILVAVVLTALKYRNDPSVFDHDDIFNREKAKEDLSRRKKQIECCEECDALEKGVAARQRSRYLRFARPPQEKQLIEARKKILKERKALSVIRDAAGFISVILLLMIVAYGKDTGSQFLLNAAIKNTFVSSGPLKFSAIKTRVDWFAWSKTTLLSALHPSYTWNHGNASKVKSYLIDGSSHVIGDILIRQQRVREQQCETELPYKYTSQTCRHDNRDTRPFGTGPAWKYTKGSMAKFMYGEHGLYDGSGYVFTLNTSRTAAVGELEELKQKKWLDRLTRAVVVEFTVYNTPANLFSSVDLLLELPPTGGAFPAARVMSTYLFRYVTGWDNFVLACELLFFVVMMYQVKIQACKVIEQRALYLRNVWNIVELVMCVLALAYCLCFVYRFSLVSSTVEELRSTYYERFVNVSFIAFWDDMLRCVVGILLFLSVVRCLQLLKYNKQGAMYGDVYRRAHREILLFLAVFLVVLCMYTSLGYLLFGAVSYTFRDLWVSLLGVTAFMTREYAPPELASRQQTYVAQVFIFTFCVFAVGFLTAYIIAVLLHYFKSRRKRRHLGMQGREAMLFYWKQLRVCLGFEKLEILQEPEVVLPPEFTMAEIEYQVEELLFRMNALTGSHGLPEKPPCYLTDSDCTYGAGDDGISSGGSEGHQFGDDRLEQRVHKIEDNMCSQEPFMAQLLKLDSICADDFSRQTEKQLRSHLELEIFRQLQLQRQEVREPPGGKQEIRDGNSADYKAKDDTVSQQAGAVSHNVSGPGKDDLTDPTAQGASGCDQDAVCHPRSQPSSQLRPTSTSLTIQTLQDLIARSTLEMTGSPEMTDHDLHRQTNQDMELFVKAVESQSKWSPESRRDSRQQSDFERLVKGVESKMKRPQDRGATKPRTPNTSTEKMSPELPKYHDKDNISGSSDSGETVRRVVRKPEPPVKPTFLQASLRDPSSEACKGSPVMKLRPLNPASERGSKGDNIGGVTTDTSSGSEQDGGHCARKLIGKRNLRKTKSRGKGKGPDSLAPATLLDELESEQIDGLEFGMDKQEPIPEQDI